MKRRTLLWIPLVLGAALSTAFCGPCDNAKPPNYFDVMREQTAAAAQKARTIQPGTATPPPSTPTRSPSPTATDIAGLDYAKIQPISAKFDENAKSTTYTLTLTGPFYAGGTVTWSGPNCGSVTDTQSTIKATPKVSETSSPVRTETATFTWSHPHPPCGDTTDHRDATIVATIIESSRVVSCTYVGSASGTGTECFRR